MNGSPNLLPMVSDPPGIELLEKNTTANPASNVMHDQWSSASIGGDDEDSEDSVSVAAGEAEVAAAGQHTLPTSAERNPRGRSTTLAEGARWNFYDDRMISIRMLLQLTFLCDPCTRLQASLNKKLRLSRFFYACSNNPQTCVGFGTLLRWSTYLLFACTAFAMWGIMFTGDNIPTITNEGEGFGKKDFTQLPVKIATVLFTVEVMTTMLLFPTAASNFSSRHISRDTVKKMSNGILAAGFRV